MTSATTAKKSAAKATETPASKFEIFRDRAIAAQGSATELNVSDEPFILNDEQGFPFTVTLEKPGFKTRLAIDAAIEAGATIRLLQLIFGGHLDAVLDVLDAYEITTGEPAADVLTGLTIAYLEHFYGVGATSKVFPKLSI